MERPKTLLATDFSDEEPGNAEVINGAIVCVKPGERLTAEDRAELSRYIDFCRERARKRREKLQ